MSNESIKKEELIEKVVEDSGDSTIAPLETKPRLFLAMMVFMAFTLSGFLLRDALVEFEHRNIANQVEIEAEYVTNTIEAHLKRRIDALNRMAKRWGVDGVAGKKKWEIDALNYVNDFGDYQAIEWVDENFVVRWIAPLAGNEKALDMDLGLEPRRRAALENAKNAGRNTLTSPINLVQGGKGCLLYCPIFVKGDFKGFILGVYKLNRLFEASYIDQLGDFYRAEVKMSDELVFTAGSEGEVVDEMAKHVSFESYTVPFEIILTPTKTMYQLHDTALPDVTAFIGAVLGLLGGFVVHQTQISTFSAKNLNVANEKLQLQIHERSHAQAKVLTMNKELEGMVNTLGQTNEELEQYVYTASHDLKSPIVTIQGFAAHLRKDVEANRLDRLPKFVTRIEGAVEKMLSNIDDLLSLSRVGKVEINARDVNVNEIVECWSDSYREAIDLAGVELIIQEGMPMLVADPILVVQVFENLMNNAMKYGMTNVKPVISVSGYETEEYVCFCVKDNGEGIDPKYHETIFGLFQRLANDKEGTGIGLAIVKRVVERHGGRAWLESQLGSGATFWMKFPKLCILKRVA